MSYPVHYHEGKFPPHRLIQWEQLIPLLAPAAAALARYDGLLSALPNPALLLSPLTTQEAVLSSRIEGTQTTVAEVLEFELDEASPALSSAQRAEQQEVLNYRRAMGYAAKRLEEIPLSLRLIKELHQILMAGARGHGKGPGELRRLPNWIGPPGSTIETARFVPIDAASLPAAMGAWEAFIHQDFPDRLVQLAIIHAEFEALHPFLDGNGRLGRILIPLFLWQHDLIGTPVFYLSEFLETNRQQYYDKLLAVSRDDDWTGWCKFFLLGVREQARENLSKAQAILALYEELKPRIISWTNSPYAIHVLDQLFLRPILRSTDLSAAQEGISDSTARRILNILCDEGVLQERRPARGRRAALYAFPRLLNIAEGREVF